MDGTTATTPNRELKHDLTDGMTRAASFMLVSNFPRNRQVYVGYQNFAPFLPETQFAGELFEIVSGRLKSLATIPIDMTFVSNGGVDGSYANPNHTLFSVLDEAVDAAVPQMSAARMSLFRRKDMKTPYVTRLFPNTVALSSNGPPFTADGCFVTFNYSSYPDGALHIMTLSISDLSTVGELVLPVMSTSPPPPLPDALYRFSNGPETFCMSQSGRPAEYILLADAAFNPVSVPTFSKSFMRVIRVSETGGLTQVAEQPLPQFAVTYKPQTPPPSDASALKIVVGLRRSIPRPSAQSIYQNPANYQSLITGDSANLRLYSFNGQHLSLDVGKTFESGVATTNFHPSGIFAAGTYVRNSEYSLSFYRRAGAEVPTLESVDTTVISPDAFGGRFSEDGAWLLLGGATSTAPPLTFNLLLYQIQAS